MDDNIEYTDEGLPCFVNKDYVPNDFTGKCYFSMNGYTCYVVNGKLHREDGPAATLDNGQKEWYVNNELHRVGGPAKEFGCGKFYYLYVPDTCVYFHCHSMPLKVSPGQRSRRHDELR